MLYGVGCRLWYFTCILVIRGVSYLWTKPLSPMAWSFELKCMLYYNMHHCTCHKDLEQISSILSVELIFNIFCIYYCSRFRTSWCHGCCSLLKHILYISSFVFVIPKDRSHDQWHILLPTFNHLLKLEYWALSQSRICARLRGRENCCAFH